MKKYVYAVSSCRDYGDGEVYFGTDGVFPSEEKAMAYIEEDAWFTAEEYKAIYDDDDAVGEIDRSKNDYSDVRLMINGHSFFWRIDIVAVDDAEFKEG